MAKVVLAFRGVKDDRYASLYREGPPRKAAPPQTTKQSYGLLPVAGFLQRADVEFFHFEQRLHDAIGFLRVGVAHEFADVGRNDLPGEAELVLEPAAHAFLASVGREFGPVVVNFVLRFARDDEGDCICEFELRAGVKRGEFLAV